VVDDTAPGPVQCSREPPSSETRAADTSKALKGDSITATAIRNFGDCVGTPSSGA